MACFPPELVDLNVRASTINIPSQHTPTIFPRRRRRKKTRLIKQEKIVSPISHLLIATFWERLGITRRTRVNVDVYGLSLGYKVNRRKWDYGRLCCFNLVYILTLKINIHNAFFPCIEYCSSTSDGTITIYTQQFLVNDSTFRVHNLSVRQVIWYKYDVIL